MKELKKKRFSFAVKAVTFCQEKWCAYSISGHEKFNDWHLQIFRRWWSFISCYEHFFSKSTKPFKSVSLVSRIGNFELGAPNFAYCLLTCSLVNQPFSFQGYLFVKDAFLDDTTLPPLMTAGLYTVHFIYVSRDNKTEIFLFKYIGSFRLVPISFAVY